MKKDFKQASKIFFKSQLAQSCKLINNLLNMIVSFDKPKNKLMDYTDTYTHKRGGMIRRNVKSAQ